MKTPVRDIAGEEARKLIDEILARTQDDFILHFSWKSKDATNKIEQHLSFHGSWNAGEIMATGKGRNQQIEEIVMRSLKGGGRT